MLDTAHCSRFYLVTLLFVIFLDGGLSPSRVHADNFTTQFSNPLDVSIGDPSILQDRDHYYLYGTTKDRAGFEVWSSTDLVNWRRRGFCFQKTSSTWAQGYFWAPEVIRNGDKYYLYYTGASVHQLHVCVASSNSPLGPFTDLKAPMAGHEVGGSNVNYFDPSVFHDQTSGSYYLYFAKDATQSGSNYSQIGGAKLKDNMTEAEGSLFTCFNGTQEWEKTAAGKFFIEGPYVIKHGAWYYMQYSGNEWSSDGYATGYAWASGPAGPWTKFGGNPILKGNSSVFAPGHGCFAASPDGAEIYAVYHSRLNGATARRQLAMDKIQFKADGGNPDRLSVPSGPTAAPQPLPSGAAPPRIGMSDDFTSPIDRARWNIFEEYPDQWRQSGGQILIDAYGELWAGTRNDARNLFLAYAPRGDFILETKVNFNPTLNYDAALLVAFQNQCNYVYIATTYFCAPAFGLKGRNIQVQRAVNGVFDGKSIANPIAGNDIYLRIKKRANHYTFYFSQDRVQWVNAGTEFDAIYPGPLKVGFGAFATQLNAPTRTAAFDDFRLAPIF